MPNETKTLRQSSTQACQNCGAKFLIEPEDFGFYKRINVPAPTWCPECRATRRFVFWNEHNLFRKKDTRTGKEIFSTYPRASPIKIYEHDYWWSDKWDPLEYGRDYDFSRPFFEQFRELLHEVPLPSREIKQLINSDYCNYAGFLRNCYLCFDCDDSEDCLYGVGFRNAKSSVDFTQGDHLELCYEVFSCARCHKTFFSTESVDCRDVWFSRDCVDCNNCFGCVNLWHKKYHIFNVPYTKEEYYKKVHGFNLGSYSALTEMKKKVYEFWPKFPFKYAHSFNTINVIGGEYTYRSKDTHFCYQCAEVERVKYCQNTFNRVFDSYDYTNWGDKSELIYESVVCGSDCKRLKFCLNCWPGCEDLEYSVNCHSSTNLLGCVGLNKKSYCILNKRYAKDEFYTLREKIIEHMNQMPYKNSHGRIYKYGEFFPPEFSFLAYNESVAVSYLPLDKEGVVEKGFVWREPEIREFVITVSAEDLPDHIKDVNESICKEIIECLSCKKAYRIVLPELQFYKRIGLPLPRLCYACRYKERIKMRNPLKWYSRRCMCDYKVYKNTTKHKHHLKNRCSNEFHTTYALARPEIIYCEECYQTEVV